MSDLIRREDVIKKIVGLNIQVYEGDTCVGTRTYLTKEEIIYAIDDIPSVESEKKKSKWQVTSIKGETWGICSNCNFKQKAGELNFCPNCGADMRNNKGKNETN